MEDLDCKKFMLDEGENDNYKDEVEEVIDKSPYIFEENLNK